MLDLGPGEQHRRAVRAGRDAGPAPNADCGIEGLLLGLRGDRHRVRVRLGAGLGRNVATCLDHPVERRAVGDQVSHHREGRIPERLDLDRRPVGELPHIYLAGGHLLRPLRVAVDHQRAGAADPLAAVAVEGDHPLLLTPQSGVQLVEHLEEGAVGVDVLDREGLEVAIRLAVELPPYLEVESHL